ncbi:glycosyltransferase family 4 protein [Cupriavidus sp.]|uniref:glycosyltransferase family 4 protein n=2 Tax=unclassified Cupriavidus TaxID=2640874 RepID=UPI0025C104EF|nr:glycosyltransferase family 4 protein [Cupriavidus sp.]MCA3184233.1 glycosyltransferase family 4 protein [Cupriavidus sp.]MCA3193472.1 glycosyltransferase family 4 protein [Cupriavidus sp.]MCA3199619.1 glycosyltransferase family 4 protein [Cupriavidus sp.]MCA3203349.1 glycosyltransferase family 4 protein [Cupriavidus sp.]MCA3210034.1 glycosyltransferase family 4 protein [Cupriavidus sp.]
MTMPNAFGPIAKQPAEGGTPPTAAPRIESDRTPAALTRPVVFLGPLPPPHNGFSASNQRMLDRIRERAPVEVLDVAKRASGRAAGLKALANRARQLWRLGRLIVKERPHTLYLGLSGGFGQLLDAPFVALANLSGMAIYFHHHSFAYINRPTWYTRLIMRCAPRGRHLVLCDMMGAELSRIYGLPTANVQVLSNLSLIDLPDASAPVAAPPEAAAEAIRVGFLSNITAAKGIFTFFEVVRLAQEIGMPVCARIAGPVAPDIRARFDAELARTPCVRYLGPVHGAQKEAFFRDLDALLFPTTYHNEAAPLILLEAQSHGVPVIANDRGCIGSMIDDCNGVLVPRDADFAEYAIAWLRKLMSPDGNADARRAALLSHFQAQRQRAEAVLDRTIAAISAHKANSNATHNA